MSQTTTTAPRPSRVLAPATAARRRAARAASPALDPETAQALADTFRVLGDPTRIRLIAAMAVAERCVGDLATRLVRTRRAGRQVFYSLDDGHIVALFHQGLSHVHERPGVPR
jgi:DNA-binding transcriptional ArsR family regulator